MAHDELEYDDQIKISATYARALLRAVSDQGHSSDLIFLGEPIAAKTIEQFDQLGEYRKIIGLPHLSKQVR